MQAARGPSASIPPSSAISAKGWKGLLILADAMFAQPSRPVILALAGEVI